MKSAKLAVLALLAASLTAGSIPAYGYSEVPAPVPVVEPTSDAGIMTAPPSPDAVPGVDAVAPVPEKAAPAEPAPATTPADVPTEPAVEHGEMHTDEAEEDEAGEDLGYDPVVGGGFPVPGPNTPMVTDPDGTVRSAVETDISAAHDHEPRTFSTREGGASTAGAAARSGTMQVTLVFATLTDNRNSVDENAARNSVGVADAYWRAMSNGRIGMNIAGVRHINSSANSGQDYAAMMNTIRGNLGWRDSPGNALLVFVPAGDLRSGGYGGILGGGWISGDLSGSVLMPKPSSFTNNVVAHEFGHVLGLLHANGLTCNNGRSDVGVNAGGRWSDTSCYSKEYADTLDLMGFAQNYHPVINSYLWDMGGFGKGNEIRNAGTVEASQTHTLTPWGGSAANRAVKFTDPVSKDAYYLELRQPVGYDEHLKWDSAGNRGVKIIKADAANSWALNSLILTPSTKPSVTYNPNQAWQAGQTFTTYTGTNVKINSVNASSASVTITAPPSAANGSKAGSLYFNGNPVTGSTFGTPTDQFLTCDWDGDGVSTPATFYKGIWTLRNSLTDSSLTQRFSFGDPGDQPICGDWDGDGKDTIGVYRSGVAYVSNSNAGGMADGVVSFGDRGDTAIVGDWNRDGYDTLGVARGEGAAKRFYLTNSNLRPTAEGSFLFGNASDTAIAGDWDNDGYSTVGLQRGNTWYLSNSNMRVLADRSFMFGDANDRPLTGRWARGQATNVGVAR